MNTAAQFQPDRRRERTFAATAVGLNAGAAIAVYASASGVWLLALLALALLTGPGVCLARLGRAGLPDSLMFGMGVNVALVMVLAQICVMIHWWHPRLAVTGLLALGIIGNVLLWSGLLGRR